MQLVEGCLLAASHVHAHSLFQIKVASSTHTRSNSPRRKEREEEGRGDLSGMGITPSEALEALETQIW